MKNFLLFATLTVTISTINAQPSPNRTGTSYSFIDYQKSFPRPGEALQKKEDTLRKQFEQKKLTWPARYIYIRSFKYDSQLEVWVKDRIQDPFQLFKTYKVCALAGSLGPKRMEGDYQVPEGFYYINEFNPYSNYHLSLGINYPNVSDKVLSDSLRPGSAIYIHGSCVTVGCIPITDQQIDELYILAAYAKDQGQDFIPVHIFPIRFNKDKSVKYLETLTKDDPALKRFARQLEDAFDYFEKNKQLPVVMIGEKGQYMINNGSAWNSKLIVNENDIKRPPREGRTRKIGDLAEAVHQWPEFPGGHTAYTRYLEQLGKEMAVFLPTGVKKLYVQVEFIVDKDGVPVNFKMLKGTKEQDFTEELFIRMEEMGTWKPAQLHGKPVARKMVQTLAITAE